MENFHVVLIAHCTLVFFLLQLVYYSFRFFAAHFVERIAVFVTCLLVTLITFRFTKKWCLQYEIDIKKKAILITGCDSGLGYLLAQRLDRKGFKVFASCLFPHGPGANELKTILSEHSKVFGLDVTKQGSIKHALKFVKENLGSYELWAVINNAGVRKGFSMELSGIKDFEDCIDVNALGHVRITKAFLNLLRTPKGRIINVNSIFSRIPIAGIIPYCMSKYAAAGFNDCLRTELASTGIKVISVDSIAFLSPMTETDVIKKSFEEKIAENEDKILKYYGKSYIENYRKLCTFFMRNTSKDIHLAVNDLEHAVCSQYPDIIYNTCPKVVSLVCLKIQALLPPFIQDAFYLKFANIICKVYRYYNYINNYS